MPRLPLVFWLIKALVCIVTFLFAGVAIYMAQVFSLVFIFLCYFNGVNLSGWISLSFSLTFLRVGGWSLRLISGKQQIMGLSFFFIPIKSFVTLPPISVVFVIFHWRLIPFWAPKINFPSLGRWLKAGFCFYINNFLYHLILRIQVLLSIIQLNSNRRA